MSETIVTTVPNCIANVLKSGFARLKPEVASDIVSLSMDMDMFDVTCYKGKRKVRHCVPPYKRYIRDPKR